MLRLGLCCLFRDEPIRFRRVTATAASKDGPAERKRRLAEIVSDNAAALKRAIEYCRDNGIGAFRVNSQLLSLATHPVYGYRVEKLPGGSELAGLLEACGALAREADIRLSFHPDQFVVLNSPRDDVRQASIRELEHQAGLAALIGAGVVNVHGGGAYDDRAAARKRLAAAVRSLSKDVRRVLTLENDDRVWTPAELIPVCLELGLPFVYDVHHHRCLPDGRSIAETTERALATWTSGREPLFHISSPAAGWGGGNPKPHADFIDTADFPAGWIELGRARDLSVDVEAKAKEAAVKRLRETLEG